MNGNEKGNTSSAGFTSQFIKGFAPSEKMDNRNNPAMTQEQGAYKINTNWRQQTATVNETKLADMIVQLRDNLVRIEAKLDHILAVWQAEKKSNHTGLWNRARR